MTLEQICDEWLMACAEFDYRLEVIAHLLEESAT